MLDFEYLKKLAIKFQTRQENIVREYLQHLFLSFLYKLKGAENLFLKVGRLSEFCIKVLDFLKI